MSFCSFSTFNQICVIDVFQVANLNTDTLLLTFIALNMYEYFAKRSV